MLVIATYPGRRSRCRPPRGRSAGHAAPRDGVDRILLRGLDDETCSTLLESLAGHALDDDGIALRDALRAETDGNPFFTVEILRHLSETGAITQDDTGRGWPPPTWPTRPAHLGARGHRRTRGPPRPRAPAGPAPGVGHRPRLRPRPCADVADLDEDRLLDLLEPAGASLIAEIAPGRFSFAHALIEHTLYQEICGTRRARLHLRAAEQLEETTSARPQDRMLELARHWTEAMVPETAPKTAEYARQAGELSLARLAPEQARTWFRPRRSAAPSRSGAAEPALRCALSVGLGDALRRVGDPTGRDTLLEAARCADEFGDVALLARAALSSSRGSRRRRARPRVVEVLRLALDRVGADEHGTRALLLAVLAAEQLYHEPVVARRPAIDEAIAEAPSGDDRVLVRVLNLVYASMWVPGTVDERRASRPRPWRWPRPSATRSRSSGPGSTWCRAPPSRAPG